MEGGLACFAFDRAALTALLVAVSPRRLPRSRTSPRPTSSGCRTTSSRRARRLAAAQPRRGARHSAPDRARRSARRSDLPEGQAAQGAHARAHRVRRRARPHRGSCAPRARDEPRRRYSTSAPPAAPAAGRGRAARGTRHDRRTTTARGALEVPSGTEIDVRLQNNLNSGTAQVEDRFEATTLVDVNVNGRTAIPAGSVMRGVVTAVEPATRTNRTAQDDGELRPGDGERPRLSDARHGDAGDRRRRHQGRDRRASAPAPASARSSAASSAASRARWPAS